MTDLLDMMGDSKSKIPVDHGVPLAPERTHIVRTEWDPGAFPFDSMAVGDSFSIRPPPRVDPIRAQNKVSGAASKLHRETSKRFTTRQMRDGSIRCWRIA